MPAYSVSEMDGDMELQIHGDAIEGALCAFDIENGNKLRDSEAIQIIESLLDVFHFGDKQVAVKSALVAAGVAYVGNVIRKDLHEVDAAVIVKILGVIRFVANRRTRMGREYMDVIHRYVGERVDTGVRIVRM